MRCWLNGEIMPVEQATVPVLDRGFLYGDSLFETLRISRGRPVLLDRHLQRLYDGAAMLGFAFPVEPGVLRQAALDLPQREGLQEGVLRIALSRGLGPRGPLPVNTHSPTLLLTLSELPPGLDERLRRGARVITAPWRKPTPDMLPNNAKLGNYLNSILAMQSVAPRGADEALLLAAQGDVAECSYSSIFLVHRGRLVTPWLASGALAGITRAFILQLARELDIPAIERRVEPHEFATADEVFLTGAVGGVMPVAGVDQHRFAVPGSITSQVREAYEASIGSLVAAGLA